jgi:hypothetical protein
LRRWLDAYEWQDFFDLAGVKRITIVTELEGNEEHTVRCLPANGTIERDAEARRRSP